MLANLFLTINAWMTGSFVLAAIGCFLWGVVSVLFSPCHLASLPLLVSYVAGQGVIIRGREAAGYAGLFTVGLFLSISLAGLACLALGRMVGDTGPWWPVAVGLALVWLGLDMLGVAACRLGGGLQRLRCRGRRGAFTLGLAYGVLSGSCTFGFIAPILAIITTQKQVLTGITLLLIFACGHCLPIAIAGCSATMAQRLVASRSMQTASVCFRRAAGTVIITLGVYLIGKPFME